MAESNQTIKSDGLTRIRKFAGFFKAYMSISAVVTAALPIPVTAIGAIATYKFQTKVLSTYASLYCFLLLAFIFFSRHQLARIMFYRSNRSIQRAWQVTCWLLPLLLLASSMFFAFQYHRELRQSITEKRKAFDLPPSEVTDETILSKSLESQTPEATRLMIYYLGIFMAAEAAFILMAMREHLQDVLQLSDVELIDGAKK